MGADVIWSPSRFHESSSEHIRGKWKKMMNLKGKKKPVFFLKPGFCFKTLSFFTGPTILQVPGSHGIYDRFWSRAYVENHGSVMEFDSRWHDCHQSDHACATKCCSDKQKASYSHSGCFPPCKIRDLDHVLFGAFHGFRYLCIHLPDLRQILRGTQADAAL